MYESSLPALWAKYIQRPEDTGSWWLGSATWHLKWRVVDQKWITDGVDQVTGLIKWRVVAQEPVKFVLSSGNQTREGNRFLFLLVAEYVKKANSHYCRCAAVPSSLCANSNMLERDFLVLSFAIDDATGEPLDGVPATVHGASRFEYVAGQEDALRIQPAISVFGKSIEDSSGSFLLGKSIDSDAGKKSVFAGGCGLFGGARGGSIFGGGLGKSALEEQTNSAVGCHAENGEQHHLVIFSRGHKAAQRCLQLIKMFTSRVGRGPRPDRFASAGWNLEGLRTIAGRRIVDKCVAQLESERKARFGRMMASLIFDTSIMSTAGRVVSTPRTGASATSSVERETSGLGADRRTLHAIAEEVAEDSSRFVTESQQLFRIPPWPPVSDPRVCSPHTKQAKLLLAFHELGERIESSLRLLARRADEVDDVPLQIVVTSMNGDDLLKHDTTVFLSTQNRANIAHVKNLVRQNVRKDSEQERNTINAEEQRLVGALGKEFWAAVGGGRAGDCNNETVEGDQVSPPLRERLVDGFQEVIFEEPVSVTTLECGRARGYLVLAVGFHLRKRIDEEDLRLDEEEFSSELRLVPVLYFVPSHSVDPRPLARTAEAGDGEYRTRAELCLLYWSGKQLLDFMLDKGAENRWHHAQFHPSCGQKHVCTSPEDWLASVLELRWLKRADKGRDDFVGFRSGRRGAVISLDFDRGGKAAAVAHAKLKSAHAIGVGKQPIMTVANPTFLVPDRSAMTSQSVRQTFQQALMGRRGDFDIDDNWLRQSAVSKLKHCTSSSAYTKAGVRVQWNLAVLDQLTAGQSAETNRKVRAEIDSARLFRCPDFIRALAKNDDATALDRLEIIPYGSTDICRDDITLLDLLLNEEYDAEFSNDPTGKTVVTVRFHAVLRAAPLPPREGSCVRERVLNLNVHETESESESDSTLSP